MPNTTHQKTALISVFDKKNIVPFARSLVNAGYIIIATNGTRAELEKHGIKALRADRFTKNPSGFSDCIQTISFQIQAGILYNRSNSRHAKFIAKNKLTAIDMVVCNFPPIRPLSADFEGKFNIQNVDVGGPLMIRAAATNYKDVVVVTNPKDYDSVARAIKTGKMTRAMRLKLAAGAFQYSSDYDQKLIECVELQLRRKN